MRDGSLAKIYGRQVQYHRLASKKTWRAGKRCVNFFEPANDRNDWGKNKGNVRSASHANQLACWFRNCVHGARLGVGFRMVKDGPGMVNDWLMASDFIGWPRSRSGATQTLPPDAST